MDPRSGLVEANAAALFWRLAADRALDVKQRGDAREGLLSDRRVAALGDLVEGRRTWLQQ